MSKGIIMAGPIVRAMDVLGEIAETK